MRPKHRHRSGRDRSRGGNAGTLAGMALAVVTALLLAVLPVLADRTPLKPGWNLFSPQQDVELGSKLARQTERQLPILNDARVNNYLNSLGHRLAAHAPGYRYPYQFHCVNSGEINAFALPGGNVFVNRGAIEAADDEAQLASVMAHEISHVALRHGTNQASKAYAWQVPLSILGGVIGSNSVTAVLAQYGTGFVVNSIFLKYSRTDESQADILGTQILYDSGYDPRAMAQFFEKIEAESKSRPVEFFSDHPSPEHRVDRVDEEIDKLGGPPPHYRTDSTEFESIKRYLTSLPPPPKARAAGGAGSIQNRPEPPSNRYQGFQNSLLSLQYPDNWHSYGRGNAMTIAPDSGMVDTGQGNAALAYGVILNLFVPYNDTGRQLTLEQATDQLIQQLEATNPRMTVTRHHESMRLDGLPALSTYLGNDSPAGGRETDWVVTVFRPDGLLYFVCVAPNADSDTYERTFQRIIDSVRFPQ